ncbi:MAG: hypothetical protein Q7T59_04425 [Candidatus Woesebacteria bacterium]|nr:hypothetical protein [Candidatus Woesebacteria bacterium]
MAIPEFEAGDIPSDDKFIKDFFVGCDLYDPNPLEHIMLNQVLATINRKLDDGELLDAGEEWLEKIMGHLDNATTGGDFIKSAIIQEDGTLEISEYLS